MRIDAIPIEILTMHTIVATAVDGRYPRAPYRARCTCGAHFGSRTAGAGYVAHLERLTRAFVPERESTVKP